MKKLINRLKDVRDELENCFDMQTTTSDKETSIEILDVVKNVGLAKIYLNSAINKLVILNFFEENKNEKVNNTNSTNPNH